MTTELWIHIKRKTWIRVRFRTLSHVHEQGSLDQSKVTKLDRTSWALLGGQTKVPAGAQTPSDPRSSVDFLLNLSELVYEQLTEA